MKKRIIVLLLVSLMIVSVMPSTSYAASGTKRTTLYYGCYKSGDTVYCIGLHHLYKVNLKNRQVKVLNTPPILYVDTFKLKGKYLYCAGNSHGIDSGCIYRINTKTGKYKMLAKKILQKNGGFGFAISGSKIYYSTVSWSINGPTKYTKRVMSLSGKSKKKTNKSVKVKRKATNNRSYTVLQNVVETDNFYGYYYYLKTPNGNIYLGTDTF